ncbi:MAG: hypothetical protein E7243_20570 [Lacrimispora celerecrescens]|nr:hypothetical protein [Lacrimispora celerecrescens]
MIGLQQIQQIHFQQAFLGANGIDVSFGLSTVRDMEANGKRAIIKNSRNPKMELQLFYVFPVFLYDCMDCPPSTCRT